MSLTIQPVDNTMGAILIGTIVSAALLGVAYVQMFYYFVEYSKDHWHLKLLVTCTVLCDSVHQALISHTAYTYLVTNYNNPAYLQSLVWSLLLEVFFNGATAAMVQSFYATRVYRLSRSILFSTFIMIGIVVNAGCAIDILIATSLVILLYRSRSGFKHSDTMINRLILFVVNTGVMTSLAASGAFISLLASPHTLLYAPWYLFSGRLYTNSLLASLNARKFVTNGRRVVDETSDIFVSMPQFLTSSTSRPTTKASQNIAIRVDTTQEQYALDSRGKIQGGIDYDLKSQQVPSA
ncbi:hypothetical protein L208DRAFT_50039 [Tricholoma matsutake]|nr:hypothetical protein L208DRAFT_50039 [Tricholoma matsutake 945]